MTAWTMFASRFCSFEVPSGWILAPGVGAIENRDRGFRRSVLVAESWPDPPVDARTFAEKQQQMLKEAVKNVEVVKGETLADPRFDDAFISVLRTTAPDGTGFLQRQLAAVCGNLVCCLTFSGLERDVREWAEACERAERTLTLTAPDRLRTLRKEALLPRATTTASTGGPVALPFQQIAVPVPVGWQADPRTGTLTRDDATITVANHGFGGKAPDQAFADELARATREPGASPRVWDSDSRPEGKRYLLEIAVSEKTARWTSKEPRVERAVFIEENGAMLEARLACRSGDADAVAALDAVVRDHTPLPPEQRRLRPSEPWLPVELQGPWSATSPGLYMRMAYPVVLLGLQRIATPQGLAKHAAMMSQALRSQPEIQTVTREESAEGSFKGLRAIRHTLDCITKETAPLAFRTAWLEVGPEVCSVELRGEDPAVTEELFTRLLESLDPRALRSAGGGR